MSAIWAAGNRRRVSKASPTTIPSIRRGGKSLSRKKETMKRNLSGKRSFSFPEQNSPDCNNREFPRGVGFFCVGIVSPPPRREKRKGDPLQSDSWRKGERAAWPGAKRYIVQNRR